ncbi:serine hydrolase [Allocoprobacillus halotolerans]|uniref:serine-type D-Ala-D-Ala carboxypeptidase n=1 Tax=Allocoprobacillus halotolerans TaxID=2944914 RepID=A0ABY5I421_9FIRM|nr:serine hydrolase [Allocoprobacillus halotolerans]UTY38926.1 serine hydrolase [Allocoprobacillus halotolerans]
MKKIIGILVAFLFAIQIVPVSASDDIQLSLHSNYAYLYDQATQIVYLDQGSQEKIYPASMTKILTVSLALDQIEDVHEKVRISDEDLKGLYEAGASVAGFYAGEQVTYEDLLYGALLPSGADACNALARLTYGSTDGLVTAMNQLVNQLELENSHFTNVTGLHDDNHYTTAYDMAMILHHALENQVFEEVFNARTYTSSMENHTWASSLQRGKNSYNLDISQIDGAKSGFTDEAQLTLASSMTVDGHQFILVTAYAKGQYTQNHVRDAITVCQYLHDNYHEVIVYKKDEDIADYWVFQSFQFHYQYQIPETISLIVDKNLSVNDLQFEIDTSSYLIAPMEKGEKIGTISIYDNQQLLYTFDMHLSQDLSFSMLERVAYYGSIVVIVGGMITVLVVVKRKRSQK